MADEKGTRENPWKLKTAPGTSEYEMFPEPSLISTGWTGPATFPVTLTNENRDQVEVAQDKVRGLRGEFGSNEPLMH